MSVSVVIGMQWGDEGKGKIVDLLAKNFDYIVRFNGGENAGNTIRVGDRKFGLHLIPSGVFYPEKFKVIGNGVVISPEILLKEINDVESAGFSLDKLRISDRAHIILPWHKLLDGAEDQKNEIGTTKRGIGPTYGDKAARTTAIRVADLLDKETLRPKIERIARAKMKLIEYYGQKPSFTIDEVFNNLVAFSEKIKPYVVDAAYMLNNAIGHKKNILLEGAQGVLLDIDHGTYPYVTSSNTVAGAASTGSGIPPKRIETVMGITKAYTTRVGGGPFPTELKDEIGEKIKQNGNEFGTTTGRPRRCGWLDLVALKYAAMVNGVDEIAITKIDVLDGLKRIEVCIGYEIDGKRTPRFQCDASSLEKAKPIYKVFRGWTITQEEWAKATKNKEIPRQCKEYVNFIKTELNVKLSMLSYGPEREQTIIF